MRPVLALVAAALVALALTACGSSDTSATSSVAQATTTTTTGSPAPTTVTSTAVASSSNSASARTEPSGMPACVASMLSLSYLGGLGATGHGELGFALRNTSSGRCHTYGYPGVLFLTRAGSGLTTSTIRTTHDFFGSEPLTRLVIAPGQTVSFRLGVTHGAASAAGCATSHGLQVIPPDDTASVRTRIPGGAYECGSATVSPLRPGTSAFR